MIMKTPEEIAAAAAKRDEEAAKAEEEAKKVADDAEAKRLADEEAKKVADDAEAKRLADEAEAALATPTPAAPAAPMTDDPELTLWTRLMNWLNTPQTKSWIMAAAILVLVIGLMGLVAWKFQMAEDSASGTPAVISAPAPAPKPPVMAPESAPIPAPAVTPALPENPQKVKGCLGGNEAQAFECCTRLPDRRLHTRCRITVRELTR